MGLYGTDLRIHQSLLQRSRDKNVITVNMVLTSVVFSFYKGMQATTAEGYCVHIYGAAKMLEVTGPRQCVMGVLCQLFYYARTHAFCSAGIWKNQHQYAVVKGTTHHPSLMCCVAAFGELQALVCEMKGVDTKAYDSLRLQVDYLSNGYRRKTELGSNFSRGTILRQQICNLATLSPPLRSRTSGLHISFFQSLDQPVLVLQIRWTTFKSFWRLLLTVM